ncbi:T9SS sorting signal type C domain-containing protein [Flavobacterium adhaerens]|uniref:glycine-rich domain-containing protein n=1 Tax=Flavobacterium adhaerens TaxID=3149043 RepID=UPI0032B35289
MKLKIYYAFFLLILLQTSGFGQGSQTFTTSGTNSFTVPAGVTSLTVECWGGGGAGGGANGINGTNRAGGGGGGGAYTKNTAVSVTPGQVITFTVGAGGTGVTSNDSSLGLGNGNDGTASSFLTVTATGGKGGKEGNSSNNNGSGGAGGTGGTYDGGSGQNASSGNAGGGGGSAGTASSGSTGTLNGVAAVTGGGAGAAGKDNGKGNGTNATELGGGGGGARMNGDNNNYKGGDGYKGKVVISWTCSTITPTTQIGTQTFCTDNGTTFTSGNANAGQYVLVNVVKGFKYTFSVGNAFSGFSENITILDASNNASVSPATSATGASGATITDWSSSLSGQIKVVLSAGGCSSNNGTGGYSGITVTQTAIGNNLDSQAAYGTNTWVGHVYNAGNATPTINTANYVGYYTINSETISEGFGGNDACFPVLSNGVQRASIYTEGFAVIYKMKTNKNGCHLITINGDDGVLLKLNGVTIFDRWVEQSNSIYSNVLVNLDGDDDLTLEYYENGGHNVVGFSMTPFNSSTNTITASSSCKLNNNNLLLDGSSYLVRGVTNPYLTFQWQVSTDNSTWSDIASATAEDYTITSNLTATTYYRRIVKGSQSYNNGCSVISASVTVNVAPSVPGTISGANPQCSSVTGQVYSIAAVSGATSYTWTVPTGWTITSGQGTTSITVSTGASAQTGNIQVNAVNGCGTTYATGEGNGYKWVVINSVPSAPGTATPDTPTCTSFVAKWSYTANATKYFLDVSTSDVFSSYVINNLDVGNNLQYTVTGLNPASTYYYRVRAYNNCGTSTNSNRMNFSTSPVPSGVPVATTVSNRQCYGLQLNWNTVVNATGYYVDIATDDMFTNFVPNYNNFYVSGNNGHTWAEPLPSGTLYYRVRATNNCVTTGNSNFVSFSTTAPLGGTISSAQTICSGTSPVALTLSGNTTAGSEITRWEKASDAAFTSNVVQITETSNVLSSSKIGNLTSNTYFRARVEITSIGCVTYSTPVLITIGSIQAPTISSITQPTCSTATGSFTITNYNASYTYTINPSIGVTQSGATVTAPAGNYTITASATSCGNSTGTNFIIDSQPTVTANAGNALAAICTGETSAQMGGSVGGTATGGTWSGGTGTWINANNPDTATYTAGTNESGIIELTLTTTGGACNAVSVVKNITVNSFPSAAGAISGSSTVYKGDSNVSYSVPVIANATSYVWTYSGSGVTITNGTTNSPTLSFSYGATSGDLAVKGVNACGDGAVAVLAITVDNPIASSPSVGGSLHVCQGEKGVVYSISDDVETYEWTVPSGATIVSGANTKSITVDYSSTAVTGNLTVVGKNSGVTILSGGVTITVNPNSGVISLNGSTPSGEVVSYCPSNKAIFTIPDILGVSSYTWVVPSGWKTESGVAITAPVVTTEPELTVITGSSAENGTVSVTGDSFCPSNLMVTLDLVTPNTPASSQVNPTCTAKGEVTVTTPVAGTTYTLTGSSAPVASYTDTNTTGAFVNLEAGDYILSSQVGAGCVSLPNSITITALGTNTWDGSAWSDGTAITPNKKIILDGDGTVSVDVEGCSCEVKAGKTITIASDKVFKLQNELTVLGTLTFENGASLVQVNDNAVNSGTITYKRTSSEVNQEDYIYWSSPVADQQLGSLSDSGKYYSWYVSNWATASNTTVMKPAKGYIVRVPTTTVNGTKQDVTFAGEPNNGEQKIASQGINKNNLIGNPYPSAIDALQFLIDNQSIIGGSLNFWTHNTPKTAVGAGDVFVYSSSDYASYNATGGTTAKSGGAKPDGIIAAGQSFMVRSTGTGDFVFNNALRVSDSGSNTTFYKQTKTKKTAVVEANRVWLNLSNAQGAFKQLLVGYVEGATNGDDNLYDGVTLNGNTYVDFYSIGNAKNYTVQGRGLPFNTEDIVPLGYKTTIEGTFQISIDEVDGALKNQDVYLEDKTTNTTHNLKNGSYSFTTAIGTFTDRFVLKYTDSKTSLGTDDNQTSEKGLFVSVKNHTIKINSFDQLATAVKVYDLKGSLLYEKNKIDTNEYTIEHLNAADQVMIVMVQLENGKWSSKEIIFH